MRWLFSLFLLPLAACHSPERCPEVEETRACACGDAGSGVQVCLPELVWGACECPGGPSDAGLDAASPPGDPLDSGADTGSPATPDDDAGGMAPGEDASAVEDAGLSDSGAGADAGDAGDAGEPGEPPPFGACEADQDCGESSICRRISVSTVAPPSEMEFAVCAASCSSADDCAVPEGSFEAVPMCGIDGRCWLDCTGFVAQASCPAGMACQPLAPDDVFNLNSACTHAR